jgi:ABC-type multidrug transport system fused ATPase/permease subunit
MRLLGRILGLMRGYGWLVTAGFVFALLQMGLSLTIPRITQQIIDRALLGDEHDLLYVYGGALLVIGALRLIFSVLRRLVTGKVSLGIEYDLRNRLWNHLVRQPYAYFDRWPTGQLMSRAMSDVQNVRMFLGYGLIFFSANLLTMVAVAILLFVLDWQLALISLSFLPFLVIVTTRFGRRLQPILKDVQQKIADVTAVAEENVVGSRIVRIFAREEEELEKFSERSVAVFEASVAAARLRAVYIPLITFLPNVAVALLLYYGGRQVIQGDLTLGALVAFYSYLMLLIFPAQVIGWLAGLAQRAIASGHRVYELLDAPLQMTDAPDAKELPACAPVAVPGGGAVAVLSDTGEPARAEGGGAATLPASASPAAHGAGAAAAAGGDGARAAAPPAPAAPAAGGTTACATEAVCPVAMRKGADVRFENVRFAYDHHTVLDGIDLEVPTGAAVALVGHTGCGKTTLANLVPRFYDVTAGRVLVDGFDVRELTITSLRCRVGVVTQDPFLFSISIADNISLGRPKASREEIEEAARQAQADSFIDVLPEQYDTVVGERGLTLSGGQRQRIAIARALLMDPRILILDDAMSSVDVETELRIRGALQDVMRGRTTFIIAHRPSTIALADRVVVLDHGRIAEQGTHDELVAGGGHYARMFGTAEETGSTLDLADDGLQPGGGARPAPDGLPAAAAGQTQLGEGPA